MFMVSNVYLAIQPKTNKDAQAIINLTLTSNVLDTVEVDSVTASLFCSSALPATTVKAVNKNKISTGCQSTQQHSHDFLFPGTDSR